MAEEFNYIDLTYLKETSMGNEDFVKEMINLFIEEATKAVGILRGHMEERNYLAIKQAAHKLKPNLAMMGIKSLAEPIAELERLAQGSGSEKDIHKLLDEVCETTELAVKELESL